MDGNARSELQESYDVMAELREREREIERGREGRETRRIEKKSGRTDVSPLAISLRRLVSFRSRCKQDYANLIY